MQQPEAIYSSKRIVFDKMISNAQNIILTQGSTALSATLHRIQELNKICGPKEGNRIFNEPIISTIIHELCAHAGIASQILFNVSEHKLYKESETAFKMRIERCEYVKNLCAQQSFTPETLINRDMRNSLTHIDEKLADILTEEKGIGWFIDEAFSNINQFDSREHKDNVKEIKYCRCYVHNQGKILHLNQELDLNKLAKECVSVLKIVFGIEVQSTT